MMLGVAFGGMGSILSGANLLKVGIMAASAAGMYLLNGKKEKGEVARLDDLKISSSSYGRGIPIIYGTYRVTGNMIWATDFEETLRYLDPKGKGGKKGEKKGTPYYEYHGNFAMLLCEGPVEELLRVWADSNLIYDKHNPENEDIVELGFSQGEEGAEGGKSGMGAGKKKGNQGGDSGRFQFRFYSGTETQLSDPFMVSKSGASRVPAYRGRCYLFFEHFALADFGNRTPTITAEVAVKKKQSLHYKIMENMPGEEAYKLDNAHSKAHTFVDPERYKLYQFEEVIATNDTVVRVYDISTDQEVRRVTFDEIDEINADMPSVQKFGAFGISLGFTPWTLNDIIGLAGNGDLVGVLEPLHHSVVIVFLDPNTFAEKHRFGGSANPRFTNSGSTIAWARRAYPISYIHVEVNIFTGKVETTPRRATLIMSWGTSVYIFGQDHEPLVYFDLNQQSIFNQITPITQGPPEQMGGTFYFATTDGTGQNTRLLRVKWSIYSNGISWQSPHIGYPDAQVIRSLSADGGFTTGVFIDNPAFLFGIEKVIWFERIHSPDVLKEGTWAVSWDPKTEEIIWREKVNSDWTDSPSLGGLNVITPLPFNTGSHYRWIDEDTVWLVDFASQDISYYTTTPAENYTITTSNGAAWQVYWPARGAIVMMVNDPNDGGERKWAMVLVDRNDQVPADIHFIISDVSERVNIPESKVNLTKLNEQEITGFAIENPSSARKVIEDLAQVFMFDVAEIDYQLQYVSRGQASVVTIPQRDLAVVDRETQDYYIERIMQSIDLPQTVVVSYINAEKDYQVNSQHYRRPRSPMPVMQSSDKLEINMPMAMEGDFAKQLAHKVSMSLWTERTSYDMLLPWTYLLYDPTDVFTFQMDNGLTFDARMMKMDVGADFSLEVSGIGQSVASYSSAAVAQPDGGVIPIPRPLVPQTIAFAANVPYLNDEDDIGNGQFSYYWGSGAYGAGFRGAAVEYRLEGLDWTLVDVAVEEIVWGSTKATVPAPPWGPHATDDVNVITLLPSYDYGERYSWESIAPSAWPSDTNTVIIGEEIIYFRDVEILESGEILISHLIRGARGTEEASYRHAGSERFALNTAGLRQKSATFAYINKDWMFRSFSAFSTFPPYRTDIEMNGASHMPWGLNNFKRSGTGNITITWDRRTRLGGQMKDGTGTIPLNEESESYEIYLLTAPFNPNTFDPDDALTYKRKFTRTVTNLVYTTAQKTEDGFVNSMSIYLVGFQVSPNVGRGFPGYATLYPTVLTTSSL